MILVSILVLQAYTILVSCNLIKSIKINHFFINFIDFCWDIVNLFECFVNSFNIVIVTVADELTGNSSIALEKLKLKFASFKYEAFRYWTLPRLYGNYLNKLQNLEWCREWPLTSISSCAEKLNPPLLSVHRINK